jgi:hypothetical protein
MFDKIGEAIGFINYVGQILLGLGSAGYVLYCVIFLTLRSLGAF